MENKIVIVFNDERTKKMIDLEVPSDISANELLVGLNQAYHLDIDLADQKKCYLKAENPFVLLKGSKSLTELGVRDGTIVNYTGSR